MPLARPASLPTPKGQPRGGGPAPLPAYSPVGGSRGGAAHWASPVAADQFVATELGGHQPTPRLGEKLRNPIRVLSESRFMKFQGDGFPFDSNLVAWCHPACWEAIPVAGSQVGGWVPGGWLARKERVLPCGHWAEYTFRFLWVWLWLN